METAARELMRLLLEEGKRHDDVRRALISEGYNNEDFAAVYTELQRELGIKELPPQEPTAAPNSILEEEARQFNEQISETHRSRSWSNIGKVIVGFLILIFAVLMFSGIGPRMWQSVFDGFSVSENTQSPVDIARESQMRTLQFAAEAYQAKLLDYQGVCNSIGIDREAYNCVESTEAYAIEILLLDGSLFCIDSTGFAGVRQRSHGGESVCPQ